MVFFHELDGGEEIARGQFGVAERLVAQTEIVVGLVGLRVFNARWNWPMA
jgi:hypothetical protein